MEYTIISTDENHYNKIRFNLPLPSWKYSNVMITSCVSNNNILVLKKGDYIDFNIKEQSSGEQSSRSTDYPLTITANKTDTQSAQTFVATLPSISNIDEIPIAFDVNTDERIMIYSNKQFSINDVSYDLKLILDLYYKIDFLLSHFSIPTNFF